MDNARVTDLADLRRLMFSMAYRMVGSVAEAEDLVQDAFLRYHRARQTGAVIGSPRAYLATVTTRLAIDHLRSARVRRETYVGSWLPEPLVESRAGEGDGAGGWPGSGGRTGASAGVGAGAGGGDAAARLERAESLSMAFLVILETLSPVERAVFLLREVFDYDYDEIAAVVDKSEDNCRQIFVRAKRHIEAGAPRFEASIPARDELARRFFAACERADLDALVQLLAEGATFVGDGGGKATAVLQPVLGRDRVARLLQGIFTKGRQLDGRLQPAIVNGQPGALLLDRENRLVSVLALDIADGAVTTVRSVINPDKLSHLGPLSDVARLPSRPD
jgi:RNA polymerase sigma-70 factor (ECF subfamily)